MGFNFNGAQANVTITGDVGLSKPTDDQETFHTNHQLNGNATTTIRTATAGKISYITGLVITPLSTAVWNQTCTLRVDGVTLAVYVLGGQAGAVSNQVYTIEFDTPIVIPATKVFDVVTGSTTGGASYNFSGFEE